MNEIGELIEFSFVTQQENKQDEIEKGLEIVSNIICIFKLAYDSVQQINLKIHIN